MANKKDIPRGIGETVLLLLRQVQVQGNRELNIRLSRDGVSISASFMPEEKKQGSSLLSERRGEHG